MSHEPLTKTVWTQDDFEKMSWHDATIYALAISSEEFELILDIDYILKWIIPTLPTQHYSFLVAPATLVFAGVQNIKIDLRIPYITDITIQEITRDNPRKRANSDLIEWDWYIESHEGEIYFSAYGYQQFFRKQPIHTESQMLHTDERGGLSFARILAL